VYPDKLQASAGLANNPPGKKLDICYRLSIQALKQGWRVGEIPTTELVRPSPGLYKEILLSIVPVMWTLLSESLLIRARSDSV
jgi:hypothetical protein